MSTLIKSIAMSSLILTVIGCNKPAVKTDPALQGIQQSVVSKGLMSASEANSVFSVLSKQTSSTPDHDHSSSSQGISDAEIEQVIQIGEQSANLSSSRDAQRILIVMSVLGNLRDVSPLFRQRVCDIARRVLANPKAESMDKLLIGNSINILVSAGDKQSIAVINPYLGSKDKDIAQSAREAVTRLNK